MKFNDRYPEACQAGAHIFKIIEERSRCSNCGILYEDFQHRQQEEALE